MKERGLDCSDIDRAEIDGAADSDVRVRFYASFLSAQVLIVDSRQTFGGRDIENGNSGRTQCIFLVVLLKPFF